MRQVDKKGFREDLIRSYSIFYREENVCPDWVGQWSNDFSLYENWQTGVTIWRRSGVLCAKKSRFVIMGRCPPSFSGACLSFCCRTLDVGKPSHYILEVSQDSGRQNTHVKTHCDSCWRVVIVFVTRVSLYRSKIYSS